MLLAAFLNCEYFDSDIDLQNSLIGTDWAEMESKTMSCFILNNINSASAFGESIKLDIEINNIIR